MNLQIVSQKWHRQHWQRSPILRVQWRWNSETVLYHKVIYKNQFLGRCCQALMIYLLFAFFWINKTLSPSNFGIIQGKILFLFGSTKLLVGKVSAAAGATSEGKLTPSVQGKNGQRHIVFRNYVLTAHRSGLRCLSKQLNCSSAVERPSSWPPAVLCVQDLSKQLTSSCSVCAGPVQAADLQLFCVCRACPSSW
jgi:hypothetical protein